MDRAGVSRATIRKIIGHETDAMFDRYRIVDQRDIQEAGRLAGDYLRSQEGGEKGVHDAQENVTRTVTKTPQDGDENDGLSPTA